MRSIWDFVPFACAIGVLLSNLVLIMIIILERFVELSAFIAIIESSVVIVMVILSAVFLITSYLQEKVG